MTEGSSEELFQRLLESIVQPLLTGDEEDYGRLLRFVELNDEETAGALFRATFKARGGRELLESVFFAMASQPSLPQDADDADDADDAHPASPMTGLHALAGVLSGEATASFRDRFKSAMRLGEKQPCVALMSVLPEFADSPWAPGVLCTGLLDRDSDVREAASRTLFILRGADCGYDPEDPPAEREAMVQELFGLTKHP